jgi:hypothetical protein
MIYRTAEVQSPQQTKRETEPPALVIDDWAFVQRCLHTSIELFRGRIARTPESTDETLVSTRKIGVEPRLPIMPLYHLTEVHLLELDGEWVYQPYNDLLVVPTDKRYHLEHFDLASNQQHHESMLFDIEAAQN